jgi:hypothetical protein
LKKKEKNIGAPIDQTFGELVKFRGGRNLCEIGKQKSLFTTKFCFLFFLGGFKSVFLSLHRSKRAASPVKRNNCLTHLLSSCHISTEDKSHQPVLSSFQISTEEKSCQPGSNTSCKVLASCKHKASLFIFVFCFAGIASARAEKECT